MSMPPASPERFPVRLAQLGFDARAIDDVEVILPPVCDVPAGEFLMGSDSAQDNDTDWNEEPQHRLVLPTFQIARFPVTVAEYACLVRSGYPKPRRGNGYPWPRAVPFTDPVVDWQVQLKRLDHPVVLISWADAVAYASWLSHLTGELWRLPTEAEWEKAARGPEGRIFPWGETFDVSRANTQEGKRWVTTPAGEHPKGASPKGAQDTAGNVWEWTSTRYQAYPYTPPNAPRWACSIFKCTKTGMPMWGRSRSR
jgi:formylglycine-generating enzyme required for sulfatase activity